MTLSPAIADLPLSVGLPPVERQRGPRGRAAGADAFGLSFVVRWQAASVLLTLVLVPAVRPLGISPWIVGLIALVATNSRFLPYQSTIDLALYYGMGESFEHRQVRPIAWAFGAAVLVGMTISVPCWRVLGLLD